MPCDESAVPSAFRRCLSLPAFGGIRLIFAFRGRDAFIDELYIVPTHRRRRLGRQAMVFVGQEAREMGVHAIHPEVDRRNPPAVALYRQTGYQVHHRLLMTKWLNRAIQ